MTPLLHPEKRILLEALPSMPFGSFRATEPPPLFSNDVTLTLPGVKTKKRRSPPKKERKSEKPISNYSPSSTQKPKIFNLTALSEAFELPKNKFNQKVLNSRLTLRDTFNFHRKPTINLKIHPTYTKSLILLSIKRQNRLNY